MSESSSFDDLLRRVRAGDEAAATKLVQHFEPAIRRAVRFRLANRRLGALLDSMDICQSVFVSFFVRMAVGQYDIQTPEQLVKLLVTMAHNKLASQARKEQADRRDQRRVTAAGSAVGKVVSPEPGPEQQVAARELLHEVFQRFSAEERELVEWRHQGHSWEDIAARQGESAVVLRKRLSRALDRVTRQLGLEEGRHE